MRGLSVPELLSVWEQGWGQSSAHRALMLLTAACPETPADALANLSIGQRDMRLLTLRECMFGSQLASVANCESCSERLEWTFNTADLRVTSDSAPVKELSLEVDRYCIRFRLPNSLDLAVVAGCKDTTEGRQIL